MQAKVKIIKRGRPPVEISWPDVVFTAQDVVESTPIKVSRVTIHSKLNRAVDEGKLTIVGASKPKNGRPRVQYEKTASSCDLTPTYQECKGQLLKGDE